ncbi:hypothetical protein BK649_05155 [Pseudomonas canadensis]|uniref:Uncharacterized protein n=1 Tax=Pseudomonas canadensis TaxID=915099 RepID=A0A423FFL5_9PSED|nr:hypothetical protein [Pseudomonas canadensis]MEB2646860.1 hypothetical protein [Pseudomonas canadensis]ROM56350.1 hypothetical protein BK649_05155 [Pseudomonas canadensis]
MEKVDDLTREKLREWQMRRLEIKDRIQSHPEQTLELSRVLDLMDDEHAEILSQAEMIRSADVANEPTPPPLTGAYTLQLNVAAQSAEDLRRLLDMAVFELQQQVNAMAATADAGPHCGGMSGSLGEYRFELGGHGNA